MAIRKLDDAVEVCPAPLRHGGMCIVEIIRNIMNVCRTVLR